MRGEEAADADSTTIEGLNALLKLDIARDAAARIDERKLADEKSAIPQRWSNRKFIEAMDHGLRSVRGYGLVQFLPRRALHALEPQERYYVAKVRSKRGVLQTG